MKFGALRLTMSISAVLAAATALAGMGWQEKHHGTSEKPRIIWDGKNAEVVLSDLMKNALRQEVPGFKPWKMKDYSSGYADSRFFSKNQTPFAAIGDFNGDGIIDAALFGFNLYEMFNTCCFVSLSSSGTDRFISPLLTSTLSQ